MSTESKMTKPLMAALVEYHESQARYMKNRLEKARCDNCEHGGGRLCAKYGIEPPPEVKRTGCDDYVFDEIPF